MSKLFNTQIGIFDVLSLRGAYEAVSHMIDEYLTVKNQDLFFSTANTSGPPDSQFNAGRSILGRTVYLGPGGTTAERRTVYCAGGAT